MRQWKKDPVTEKVIARLSKIKAQMVARLSYGNTLGDNCAQRTATTVGIIKGLNLFLEADLVNEEQEVNSEEAREDPF